jgi:hypothetical protein
MKNVILCVLACAIVVTLTIAFGGADTGLFLDKQSPNSGLLRGFLLAAAMLGGIFAGWFHAKLSSSLDAAPRKVLATFWSDRELWKSLLASPIVFGVVYTLLAQTHDVVMAVVFSFQNGFFCNVIVEKKRSELASEQNGQHSAPHV